MKHLIVFLCMVAVTQGLCGVADTVKVTVSEGTNIAIDISPDKKSIVMDLQGTLWVLPVAGGVAVPITDVLGDCRQPTWSPDGTLIAFQSYRDGNYHLWTIRPDGSDLQQRTFGAYDDREPHWSPDGKELAFSSDRSGNYDIWKLTVASGDVKQLTRDPANDYFPAWSPTGKSIVYVSEQKQAPGLYLTDSDANERLLKKIEGKLSGPAWSPGGTMVLYNNFAGGKSALEQVLIDGLKAEVLSTPDEDVFPFRISWLSDVEYLYTADGKIKRKKSGKKGVKPIPFTVTLSVVPAKYERKKYDFNSTVRHPVKGIRGPVVSPDGNQVVFAAVGDLWLLTIGEEKPVRLTDTEAIDIDPAWSPDGRFLAYISDKAGNMDLYVRDMTTNKEHCLIDGKGIVKMPSWSRDGSLISFYEDGGAAWGHSVLKIADASSGKIVQERQDLFNGGFASWSADGKTIALSALQPYSSRYREGISKFLLMSLDGKPDSFISPVGEKTIGARGLNGPLWSPDGSQMAYVMDGVLWVVPVSPSGTMIGPPKMLTVELAEAPSWTGDSKRIVFLATDKLKIIDLTDGHIETIPMDFTWTTHNPEHSFVVHAGKVFDGRSPTYRENVDIIIKGNRITEIVPHKDGRPGIVIDASAQTVVPGLFEMHTHQHATAGEQLGRLWLAYGITSTREPGTEPYDALERKEAWASGRRKGPRAFYTGGLIDGNRVYYGMAVGNSPGGAQLELELNRAIALDYDMIKTYVRMPDQTQQRVTAFAHAHGIPVSSHEIYPATFYSVDAVEHMGATSRRGYSPKLTALNHSYADVVQLIVKSGMNITPTVSLHGGFYTLALQDTGFFSHKQFGAFYEPAMKQQVSERVDRVIKMFPTYLSRFSNVQRTVKSIMAGGGRITPGTDSPIIPPGLSLHAELQSWATGGITPFEILRSATLWSAEAVGVSGDLGTLENGKLADLLIVNGDPLKDVRDVLKIKTVIKNGFVYSLEELLKNSTETTSLQHENTFKN
jgi:Tol biopolymer transport system component